MQLGVDAGRRLDFTGGSPPTGGSLLDQEMNNTQCGGN